LKEEKKQNFPHVLKVERELNSLALCSKWLAGNLSAQRYEQGREGESGSGGYWGAMRGNTLYIKDEDKLDRNLMLPVECFTYGYYTVCHEGV